MACVNPMLSNFHISSTFQYHLILSPASPAFASRVAAVGREICSILAVSRRFTKQIYTISSVTHIANQVRTSISVRMASPFGRTFPLQRGHLNDFVLRLSKSTSSGPIGLSREMPVSSVMAQEGLTGYRKGDQEKGGSAYLKLAGFSNHSSSYCPGDHFTPSDSSSQI